MRCALCRELGHGPNGEGRLERAGANLFVHSFCLRFCPLVAEKGGAVKKSRAIREIERGSQMECAVCHKAGATMACGVQGCWKSYHLLCASRAGCKLHKLDFLLGKPPLFCPDHGNLPAAQKATKAKTLQQWTVVFDKPLEEKDRQMENSSAEENGDSHDDSESECLSKALEQSKHAPKPKSKLREKKSQVLQIDQRVKARFKQQWFPGILKRMKQNCGGKKEYGVKCDADKRNSMMLWVRSDDIRPENGTEDVQVESKQSGSGRFERITQEDSINLKVNGISPSSNTARKLNKLNGTHTQSKLLLD